MGATFDPDTLKAAWWLLGHHAGTEHLAPPEEIAERYFQAVATAQQIEAGRACGPDYNAAMVEAYRELKG